MIRSFIARRNTAQLLKCKVDELSMRSVYLPEFNIIYLINPKVASSTIIYSLLLLDKEQYGRDLEDFYGIDARRRISSERDPVGFYRHLRERRAYVFSLVRHPFTRALSCYRDKIYGPQRSRFRAYLNLDLERKVSFVEFLSAVAKQQPAEMNRHWRPQGWLLPEETGAFIKRFEDLPSAFHEIATEAGISELSIHDFRPHATHSNEAYPPDDGLVRQIYAEDFRRFGYEP